jgi:ribokinase
MIHNYGSINIDHIYRVPHLVRPGETLTSRSCRQVLGGKGANQSLAIARAGGKIAHWGRLAQGDSWVLETLSSAGVDTSFVEVTAEASGHALIQVDDQGENSIVLYPGANHGFTEARQDELLSSARPDGWLLVQNECNALERMIDKAVERGLHVAFNPAPMTADVLQLPLQRCRLLFLNRSEAADLVDMPIQAPIDGLLDALHRHLPRVEIVLTLGSAGVCYMHGSQRRHLDAYPVTALDTTAAGDTFIGYFMAARQRDADIEVALRTASAAAALCVQREGAAPSVPVLGEVEAAIDAWSRPAPQSR